ncbi:MAG: septum formation protein Maf [Alphaproteobacteria bacterium]|nr:septum formation protein Maf [Alphaproteobacteria bacterium]
MNNTNTSPWRLKSPFILASGSKARLRLLQDAGLCPSEIIPADIDETPKKKELPARYVYRIAKEKALAIAKQHPNKCILSADTVIAVGVRMIRKASTREEALENLKLLSGRRHRVITGFCVVKPDGSTITKTVTTFVIIKKLDNIDIDTILNSNQWQNVAGYQIEGMLSAVVRKTIGSFPNVVGLPIFEVTQVLRGIL